MDKELLEELKEILNRNQDVYIYGAANTAKKVYTFLETLKIKYPVKGFVVTDSGKNPDSVNQLPVFSIYDIDNRQAVIIVPHLGTYKVEIQNLLEQLNFKNICFIDKYMHTNEKIDEKYIQFEKEQMERFEKGKNPEEKEKEEILREKIFRLLREFKPDFGLGRFYQSFERLGIEGDRFTLYRIKEYGINELLEKCGSQISILDIGCNAGFFDMEIAAGIQGEKELMVSGIEYDACLVKVAKIVSDYLKLKNCSFFNCDFKEWVKDNTSTFDVIFSFAIHHWLDISSDKYVEILDSLLNDGGFFCFESHDLQSGDSEYDVCRNMFLEKKYKLIKEGKIKDDGLVEREFCVLQK